jgi:hypothetical protein
MAVHRVMWLRKQRQNKATTTKLDRHETMRTGVDANVREVKV